MLATALKPSGDSASVLRRGRSSDENPDDGVLSSDHHVQQHGSSISIDVMGDEGGGERDDDDDDGSAPVVRKQKATFASKASSSLAKALVVLVPESKGRATSGNGNGGTRSSDGRKGKVPSKVLFLDGVRGMAALFVVTEHSLYWNGKNLGACAVDIFFVLSSFLLTMLFYKKSAQLIAQQATKRKWLFTLADYFSKRFFRVYPLFAIVAIFLWVMPFEFQHQYFFVPSPDQYDLFKVLTFDFPHRYHVFWTLPLEIAYYFMIPVFVLTIVGLGRGWWVPFVPLTIWVVNAALKGDREHHMPLEPHLPTFVAGSMGAVLYVKIEAWIQRKSFEFKRCHKVLMRLVEVAALALLLSVTFKGLFFHWWHANPAPTTHGSQSVSLFVTLLIIIEMLLPSPLATMFEWNLLRYWGKISFSVYLLHSFVIYSDWIKRQRDAYDKFFAAFFLIVLLSTASYHLIEYPSQLLSARISRFLSDKGGLAQHVSYVPVAVTIQKIKIDKDDDDFDAQDEEGEDEAEEDGEVMALHKK